MAPAPNPTNTPKATIIHHSGTTVYPMRAAPVRKQLPASMRPTPTRASSVPLRKLEVM